MKSVKIGNDRIGDGHTIHVISEIGGNFTDFETAQKLIDLSIDVGANSVKLQTYRAETITSRKAVYDMPNVGNANQYDLFKKYEIDFDLHKDIWEYCKERNITVFSTPSHMSDVELLEEVGCEIYKIGSDDAYNIPFLEEIAAIGKPIILSTGMCTMNEVRESVSAILGKGNSSLILLHCVTNYPSNVEDMNLNCISSMKKEFGLPVGFSDHTLGIACSIGAAALGANILEKHFTYDKSAEGPDHMLSADPKEMKTLIDSVRTIEKSMGDGIKKPSIGEKTTRLNNRKSIVALNDINCGTVITKDMVSIKRPGMGIPPKYLNEIIGRTAKKDIVSEEPILWEHV